MHFSPALFRYLSQSPAHSLLATFWELSQRWARGPALGEMVGGGEKQLMGSEGLQARDYLQHLKVIGITLSVKPLLY